jgi:hypothetical protein
MKIKKIDDIILDSGSGSHTFNDKKWFITLAKTNDLL